jgi:hypothetical protein
MPIGQEKVATVVLTLDGDLGDEGELEFFSNP